MVKDEQRKIDAGSEQYCTENEVFHQKFLQ